MYYCCRNFQSPLLGATVIFVKGYLDKLNDPLAMVFGS